MNENLRTAILSYMERRRSYENPVKTLQERMAPTYEQIELSTEVQEALLEVPEKTRQSLLKESIDGLVKEYILDNKKFANVFPGGYSYVNDGEINARNFQRAVRENDR